MVFDKIRKRKFKRKMKIMEKDVMLEVEIESKLVGSNITTINNKNDI